MRCSKKDLIDATHQIAGLKLLVIGDLMLDRYFKGDVNRVSEEAPVLIVSHNATAESLGGAGNAIHNLVNLGAEVSACGILGDDLEGEIVQSLLKEAQVDCQNVWIEDDYQTTLKTRVVAKGQQLIRLDRERNLQSGYQMPSLNRDKIVDLIKNTGQEFDGIFISDYGKGVVVPAIFEALGALRLKAKRPISMLDPHPINYQYYRNIDFAKPNRKEASQSSGINIVDLASAQKAADVLLAQWGCQAIFISLSEMGVLVAHASGKKVHLETMAMEVLDISGAGDTMATVSFAAICGGVSLEIAADLGNIAAGEVCALSGTRPITLDLLLEGIEKRRV
ncbi:MAG TPA: bifunctional ADP-heptose synthase [Oligoflexia bacterium]|nr:bifunctional ADP-heptose synthase [Oligoflexia bacterium]HMP27098.1 bifunctional ADP-heptose synthase [Oligoflexia bacterium]